MTSKEKELLRLFKAHKGILRFSAILRAGFHRTHLKALVDSGKIKKMGRGIYCRADRPDFSNPDIVTAAIKAPNGVICLISALAFHEVTDEIPQRVDMAIPEGARANRVDYPPVRFFHFSKKAWEAGIETHEIDGWRVKIYNLAKTLADSFKFRNRMGISVAREALKTALHEKSVKPMEIMRYAKVCRVDKIIRPYLEALL